MKRKHLILLLVLVVSMLLISGCGVPREGVDVTTTPPEGLWQVYLVWPLAKGLVEKHGGQLWAEANRGTGTIFHFTLPGSR